MRMVLLGCGVLIVVGLVLIGGAVMFVKNPVRAVAAAASPQIDPLTLRAQVEVLTEGLGGFRSFDHPEVLERAADHLRSSLTDLGYEVRDQVFEVDGREVRNLVTEYGPLDAPIVVLGAHYDVCGDQPGADDNASAVVGLLEVARLLKQNQPDLSYRIELVAYTLEEPPFFRSENMGSAVHARSLADRGADVRAMICLEMIGYFVDDSGSQSYPAPGLGLLYPTEGSFIAVVGNTASRSLTGMVKARMAGAGSIPVFSINAPAAVPGLDFSDHLNYWKQGWPAVMITDTAFFRNPNYHQPSDRADSLDYERMAEVIKGVYGAVTSLD